MPDWWLWAAIEFGLAQSADKLPKVEVASVKPGKPGNVVAPQGPAPGRLTLMSVPMQGLIQYAFRALEAGGNVGGDIGWRCGRSSGGKQHITIPAGHALLVFGLD